MNKKLTIVLAVFVTWLVLAIACGGAASDKGSIADVTPTPIPPAPSFEEIRVQHDTMTDAQWKNYRSQVEGTAVIGWRGWIDEVGGDKGHYTVMIDMDSPDDVFSYPEVSFVVPDDIALALQIDQPVVFSGQIDAARDILGALDISLKHAKLE